MYCMYVNVKSKPTPIGSKCSLCHNLLNTCIQYKIIYAAWVPHFCRNLLSGFSKAISGFPSEHNIQYHIERTAPTIGYKHDTDLKSSESNVTYNYNCPNFRQNLTFKRYLYINSCQYNSASYGITRAALL